MDSESDDDLRNLVDQVALKFTNQSSSNNSNSATTSDRNDLFMIDKRPDIEVTGTSTLGKISDYDSDSGSSESSEEINTKTPAKGKAKVKSYKKMSSRLDAGVKFTSYLQKPGQSQGIAHQSQENKKSIIEKIIKSSDVPVIREVGCEESLRQQKKKRKLERASTKGDKWFGMKAPEMTEEKKNDLMVLQMRRVLDPKRFYKAPDIRALPKFFEMGTVVESAADFYSGRIPKKQRKKTLVDELLADNEFRSYNKKKYTEIQATKHKGWKGAHKRQKRLKKHK